MGDNLPINCPLAYSGLCTECTNLYNKQCYAHPLYPKPIRDILTDSEWIAILENRLNEQPPPSEELDKALRAIRELKGEVQWLRNKDTERRAKAAEYSKKKDKYLYKTVEKEAPK